MKRKLLSLILVLVISLAPMGITAAAAEKETYFGPYSKRNNIPGINMQALENYLFAEFLKCNENIDLTEFSISYSEENLDRLHNLLGDEMVKVLHVEDYSVYHTVDMMTYIEVIYKYNCNEYQSMLRECEEVKRELTEDIKKNPYFTDVEKALLLHDRLALICSYDHENYDADTIPHDSYTMYGALVLGKAVCQGYSEAYKYLLEEVGVECTFAESEIIYHIWNIVYIDGIPYHVDVTWDDASTGIYKVNPSGRVSHTNFLLSSDSLYNGVNGDHGHMADDYDKTPSDTTYDDYFWQDIYSAFCTAYGNIYYFDNSTEKLCSYDGNELLALDGTWTAGEHSYWPKNYTYLASDGKTLYLNNEDTVFSYDVKAGSLTEAYVPDLSSGSYLSIFGLSLRSGTFTLDLSDSPNFDNPGNMFRDTFRLKTEQKGDVDGDGEITSGDARLVLRYSVNLESYNEEQFTAADFDGDGSITAADARLILRLSVGL